MKFLDSTSVDDNYSYFYLFNKVCDITILLHTPGPTLLKTYIAAVNVVHEYSQTVRLGMLQVYECVGKYPKHLYHEL